MMGSKPLSWAMRLLLPAMSCVRYKLSVVSGSHSFLGTVNVYVASTNSSAEELDTSCHSGGEVRRCRLKLGCVVS